MLKKSNWPVNLSVSQEIGYPRRQYSADTWPYELQRIIDKQIAKGYFDFDPTFAKSIHGSTANQGFVFLLNVKVS